MKEPKIDIGIDQFTLVLQYTGIDFEFDDWRLEIAENIVFEFIEKSEMLGLFDGFKKTDVKIPEGYDTGYSFANSPFYFCIGYHQAHWKMGVIVKFSAFAWAEYRERYLLEYGEFINIHSFLKMIVSPLYTYRFSRIDLYVDFFNHDINVAQLKRSIQDGRTEFRYGKY